MKKSLLAILMMSLLISACAQKKNATTKSATNTTTATKTNNSKPKIDYIKISRTQCFGRCPVYDIEVYPTGYTKYYGKLFTEKEGIYEKTFDKSVTNPIFESFAEARVDTMQNHYEVMVADIPGLNIVVKVNGKEKQIKNANFGPKILSKIAFELDGAISQPDYSWKKLADKVEK